ncbi:hypothetical protein CROQUDRAFT_655825 [Cronartium quercuum f. sp. fusiforme G11]|uniref:Arylamine N-acetyltransferase n=1 Tax=Cronartium quercuum f. sp. fusiforme G11 TaxID=708437 RepID=A0A9P6NKF4_9BASI|nr:hypothetical protein CROQUDRAFT_655825 [Cronartium quercuum f. sp. fusiforme G11]
MVIRPDTFLSTTGLTPLSVSQTEAYLRRIGLSSAQLNPLGKEEVLRQVHVAHLLQVPFDTTSTQLPLNWWNAPPRTPVLIQADGHGIGCELVSVDPVDSYCRIVEQRRGGYCFNLNSLFARLLIALGYRVKSFGARVNRRRGEDPNQVGCDWGAISHLALVVETEPGVEFLCDVGFGGGSPAYPVPLVHDVEIESLTAGERFRVRSELCPHLNLEGAVEGWTLERWVKNWWSPCYHAYRNPLTFSDIEVYNWYNSTSPHAVFRSFMAVSLLQANGSRKSLTAIADVKKDAPHNMADCEGQLIKLYTKDNVVAEEKDVSIIPPTFGALYKTLVEEFRWGPEVVNGNHCNVGTTTR